jgi:hypothetical protein
LRGGLFLWRLLLLAFVGGAVLVDDQAIDGVGGGVAEELDLSVGDFEEELGVGFGEEVDGVLLA